MMLAALTLILSLIRANYGHSLETSGSLPLYPSDAELQLHTDVEPRPSYGAVFRKLPKILLAGHSDFDMVFQIPIPNIPPLVNMSVECDRDNVIRGLPWGLV